MKEVYNQISKKIYEQSYNRVWQRKGIFRYQVREIKDQVMNKIWMQVCVQIKNEIRK